MSEVRRFKAKYAVAGVRTELERSCPLAPGENIIRQGRVRVRRGWRRPLGFYRITPQRLSVLSHRAFGADEIVDVPRSCVAHVHPPDAHGIVRIDCKDGSTIEFSAFSWAQVFAAGARASQPSVDPQTSKMIYEALQP